MSCCKQYIKNVQLSVEICKESRLKMSQGHMTVYRIDKRSMQSIWRMFWIKKTHSKHFIYTCMYMLRLVQRSQLS